MAKRGRPRKVDTGNTVAIVQEPDEEIVEKLVPTAILPSKVEFPAEVGEVTQGGAIKAPKSTRKTLKEKRSELRYDVWMGVLEECPFSCVHAGGRDFPQTTERLYRDDEERVVRRERLNGKVVSLTGADINFISEAVGKKILRKAGARALILNIDDPRYAVSSSDRPLGEFVYMQIVGGKNLPHDWREAAPEPMA